jgi:hypothetical protein
MASIKCNLCRKTKHENDFLKNGKTLKSCLACRDKNKTVKEPVALPAKEPVAIKEPVVIKEPVSKKYVSFNILEPLPHIVHESIQKNWKRLSGKWVKESTELELHQELTKKMIQQFKKRAAFPVHQYLMKYVFVDIRDLYTL